jgi:hypothetical protein
LGALVVVPAVLYVWGVAPLARRLGEMRDRAASGADALRRERTLLADAARYPALVTRAESVLMREAPRLFHAPDPLAASAGLANYVGAHATRSRVFVQHSETRTAEAAGEGVATLQVELRAVGDLHGLLGFLQSLESGTKLVRVERLAIERSERIASGGRDEEVLTVAATVSGFALTRLGDSVAAGGGR